MFNSQYKDLVYVNNVMGGVMFSLLNWYAPNFFTYLGGDNPDQMTPRAAMVWLGQIAMNSGWPHKHLIKSFL